LWTPFRPHHNGIAPDAFSGQGFQVFRSDLGKHLTAAAFVIFEEPGKLFPPGFFPVLGQCIQGVPGPDAPFSGYQGVQEAPLGHAPDFRFQVLGKIIQFF
jgi:hypothetical protein